MEENNLSKIYLNSEVMVDEQTGFPDRGSLLETAPISLGQKSRSQEITEQEQSEK